MISIASRSLSAAVDRTSFGDLTCYSDRVIQALRGIDAERACFR
jgi:hypothetical protein